MATEVIMPKMGQTMEEGTILEWYKEEGERVGKGEPLFQVESDKAVFDIESPVSGTVRRLLLPEGSTAAVLTCVAIIGTPEEVLSGSTPPDGVVPIPDALQTKVASAKSLPSTPIERRDRVLASPRARRLAAESKVDLQRITGTGTQGSIVERDVLTYLAAQPRVTPLARRMAESAGIELSTLAGTGPGGRVSRADVESAHPAKAPVVEVIRESGTVQLTGVRRLIAARMAESAHTAAGLTLITQVDATEFVGTVKRFRELLRDQDPIPGYNDVLLKVLGRALQDHPYLNARWIEAQDGRASIRLEKDINIGVAIDTDRGLLVPVVRDVPGRRLGSIARERRSLTERALQGKLLPDDLVGGTFTLTNLGMFGIDAFTPIINLPECAILGAGRIRSMPAVHGGELCVREMMTLSLTFDHRVVDGAPAARFLSRVKQLIEQPSLLLL